MTEVAMALMEDIDKNTVDFRETYDGEEEDGGAQATSPTLPRIHGLEGGAVALRERGREEQTEHQDAEKEHQDTEKAQDKTASDKEAEQTDEAT